MKIEVEHLIPYTDRHDLGAPAYFNLRECDEKRLASAIAILLYRNAGNGGHVYRDENQVGISTADGSKEYRIIVVQTK